MGLELMCTPGTLATLRSGEELLPPVDRPIPLPETGRLVQMPGRLPVGLEFALRATRDEVRVDELGWRFTR